MRSAGRLERLLRAGYFSVTGELAPPRSTDREAISKKAAYLKGYVDAANVTDNQTAQVHMSAVAGALLLRSHDVEPVVQMTCRDRNLLALQSDVLGFAALGLHNILCLTGDRIPDAPPGDSGTLVARNVFDIDSLQLLRLVRQMRDEKRLATGEELEAAPKVLLGAAANPFGESVDRFAGKIDSGADFIQTQLIFDVPRFRQWVAEVRDRGLHERAFILAGVGPIKSVAGARFMQKIPGVVVPEEIVGRLERASQPREEGLKLCVEIINQIREIEGIVGIHIMAIAWDDAIPQIVEMAGLLPRPTAPLDP